jgi:type VI secretion system secreted protein Hcp
MHLHPHHPLFRKTLLASSLSFLAVLSSAVVWMMDLSSDASSPSFSSIPFALALDERLAKDLSMFLKIDGIAGTANDAKHRGEIVVDSYAFQADRPLGSSRPNLQVFTVTMPTSQASPKLFINTAGGVKIPRVTLAVKQTNGSQDIVKWILTDVTILSYKTVGNIHGDSVSDAVSFSFGRIQVEYTPLDGSTPQKAGWDQRAMQSTGN